MTKLVRVSDISYEKLSILAGELQIKARKIVSLDDAVAFLLLKDAKSRAKFLTALKNKPSQGRKRKFSPKAPEAKRHPEHLRSLV